MHVGLTKISRQINNILTYVFKKINEKYNCEVQSFIRKLG